MPPGVPRGGAAAMDTGSGAPHTIAHTVLMVVLRLLKLDPLRLCNLEQGGVVINVAELECSELDA